MKSRNRAASSRGSRLRLSVLAAAGLSVSTLHAQQGVIEEVTVTAQKRTQSMQEVPVSVTAFTSDSMANMSMSNLGDTLDFSPNVSRASGPASSSDAFFFFRGVGQVDNSVTVDPGVAIYIDEVYLGRVQGSSFELMDMERVEILRGPQGTFFGRNTVGGAVSMITKDPGEEFGFESRVILGKREGQSSMRREAYAAVDGPLSDTLSARASAFTRQHQGWATGVASGSGEIGQPGDPYTGGYFPGTGDTYGDIDDIGGRIKLVWDATDTLTAKLGVDWADSEGTQIPTVLLGFNPLAGTVEQDSFGPANPPQDLIGNTPLGVPFPGYAGDSVLQNDIDPRPYDDEIYTDAPGQADTERGGASLNLDWAVSDALNVKSITAWRKVTQLANTDLDATAFHIYNSSFKVDQDQFSQELQFSGRALEDKMNWLVGLYYFEEEVENNANLCMGTGQIDSILDFTTDPTKPTFLLAPVDFGAPPPPLSPGVRGDNRCLFFFSEIGLDIESYATFGQVEYDLTDRLTGVVGFRWTKDEKTQTFNTGVINTDAVPSWIPSAPPPDDLIPMPGEFTYGVSPYKPGGVPSEYNDSWSEFSPKLGLNYQLNDDVLLYATWSNGFKSGGFNGRADPLAPAGPYDPETIESYELGMKSEWFERRLRLNMAAFYSEYEDVQLLLLESVRGGTANFITLNGGDNDIRGAEVELTMIPTPALQLNAAAGYIETKWVELSGETDVEQGDALPNTPQWSFNFGAQYTFFLGDYGDLSLRADYSFKDEMSFQPNNDPLETQGAVKLLNLRAMYMPTPEMTFALYGTNVTDEDYFMTMMDSTGDLEVGVATASPAPGAEWGMEFSYRF